MGAVQAVAGALLAAAVAGHVRVAPAGEDPGPPSPSLAPACSAEAQQHLSRGIGFYHSFQWPEARAAFSAAARAERGCAMAYWGLALVAMGDPFDAAPPPRALASGRKLARKARAAARTPREAAYAAALQAFFREPDATPQRERWARYEEAMRALAHEHPGDLEAAILHATALAASAEPGERGHPRRLAAARILEPLLAVHPSHPGIASALLRVYDEPSLAHRALELARHYARIAPAAARARHLPSHIFSRVGAWREAIASNLAALGLEPDAGERLSISDHLVYAYLQLARDEDARRVLAGMQALRLAEAESLGAAAAYALAAAPARLALERGRFDEAARLALSPAEAGFPWERFPQAKAEIVFARALGAARSGDIGAARAGIHRLERLEAAMREAGEAHWAQRAALQRKAVAAWVAHAEKRSDEALALMRELAREEDASAPPPFGPGPLVPAREMLGELLLELGRPAQALVEFETSLARAPARFRGLYGAARAAERAAAVDKARAYYGQLVAMCEGAQDERPELASARTYIAIR